MMQGNIAGQLYTESALTIAEVPTISTLDVVIAAPGVVANSQVIGAPRTALAAGIGVAGFRTAADQIIMRLVNPTAGGLTPAVVAWDFLVFPPLGASAAI
jgi:hypothetical protein